MVTSIEAAVESLCQIKSKEPPVWLVPKQELSQAVREASKHLFSSLKPYSPKCPFDQLLIEGFDAEQIWQQIDLQSQPLLSTLRREVKKLEKHPEEISKLKEAVEGGKKKKVLEDNETDNVDDHDGKDNDDMDMDKDEDDDNEAEGKERGREEEDESEGEEKGRIEDKFFKIKELQEYLEEDEAREFGLKQKKKTKTEAKKDEEDTEKDDDDEGEEEEEENDDDNNDETEEEEDVLELFDGDDEDNLENARYEDFFSREKNKGPKEKAKSRDWLEEDSGADDEQDASKRNDGLSRHEKELENLRSKIEQMEKANLDPKVWTMRGEVTAAQRQKNSALEVDLDFEHK